MKIKVDLKFLCFVIVALVFVSIQTIAFSAISNTMTITGKSYARIATDVRISNFMLSNIVDGISNYDEFSKSAISTGFTLNSNSSNIVYTVEVSNYNSNNIGIYSVSGLPAGLNYSISDYSVGDGSLINGIGKKTFNITFSGNPGTYEFIFNFDFRSIYSISYVGLNGTEYPSYIFEDESLFINLGSEKVYDVIVTMNNSTFNNYSYEDKVLYVHDVTDNIVIRGKNQFKLVSGKLTVPGSEVCLENECFNVISESSNKITLFAKYNLYVGGESNSNKNFTAYGESATGKQDSTMVGWVSSSTTWNGTIDFSNSSTKGTNNSDYNGSVIQGYVNSYDSYLQKLGGIYSNIRLITIDELNDLGCVESSNSCENAKSFVLNTSFWTGSPYDNDYVWFVVTDGNFDHYIESNRKDRFGVRPVIEVSVEDIENPFVYFTVYGEERVALKGMTYAEWVFSEYNTNNEFQMCNSIECDSNLLTDAGFPLGVNGEQLMCTTVINEGDEVTTFGSGRFP